MDVLHIQHSGQVPLRRFDQVGVPRRIDLSHMAHVPAEVATVDKVRQDRLLQVNSAKIRLDRKAATKSASAGGATM